jgi:hypothetical protein
MIPHTTKQPEEGDSDDQPYYSSWTRFPGGVKPEGGKDDEDSPFDKPGDLRSIPRHVTAFHDNQQEGVTAGK